MSLTDSLNPLVEKKINWLRIGLYLAGLFFIVIIGAVVGIVGYLRAYEAQIYPGIYIGSEYVGEKSYSEVKNILENFNDALFEDGLTIILPEGNKRINVDFSTAVSPDDAVEFISINTTETMEQAANAGHTGYWWQNILSPLYYRVFGLQLKASVSANQEVLSKLVQDKITPFSAVPNNANIRVTSVSPLAYDIVEEKTGYIFDYKHLTNRISQNLAKLDNAPIVAEEQVVIPVVTKDDLPDASKELPFIFSYGDISLNYVDSQTQARADWNITKDIYAGWLEVVKEGDKFIFGLNKDKVQEYLEKLREDIDRPAEDAKFTMKDNKVEEFKASRTGVALNPDKTYEELNKAFKERNFHPAVAIKTVSLSVEVVDPQVKLAEINDLGVTDVIGVGESTFYGSHSNRIKNIANAVARLNGLIIKPGEEFSTIKAAGPFETSNGYLPELVIKGDKIQREVGGGMCQIGTTLFHVAMNAGMPITERRNHSLVVNYYLDPVNRNPGTDATVYDPVVDFKFMNDTGNYLLLQTAIDYKKQKLTFTLWGKSDGRKGSYTHPIVSRWMAAGETRTIEVDDLKAGVKECQGAYKGAVASFVYTRTTSTTLEIKQVFDSYYRPLPDICRIGKQPDSTCPVGQSCPVDTSAPVPAPDFSPEL